MVILDDGSTDNCKNFKIFPEFNKKVSIIHDNGPSRRENLVKNMIKVDTPYVGFMDCDLSTDLEDLENLIINSFNYDIVTGSRYLVSSKVKRSFGRLVISNLFNSGIRFLFKSKIRDHECGFKIWRTDVLRKLVKHTEYGPHKKDRRMFWDTEMWIYAQKLNYKILEIPINWNAGKKSALRFRSELSMLKYIFKLWICGKWRSIN